MGDLTWRGKLGFGGACAVCCAVPMLVLAGVVSTGAAFAGGAPIGSLLLVGLALLGVVAGRAPRGTGRVRLIVSVIGLGLAATGLLALRDSSAAGRPLVSMGLAVLALAALLALVPDTPRAREV